MNIKKVHFFGLVIAVVCLCVTGPVSAWKSKKADTSVTDKTKVNNYQIKNVVAGVVRNLFKAAIFKGAELPIKVAMAQLNIDESMLGVDHEKYTNSVLNELLNHPRILIVNQDLKTDLSLNYQLMHYLSDLETRKKGIMLGADYYISGSLKSKVINNMQGKELKMLETTLVLSNIRSNKTVISISSEHRLDHVKQR